MQSHSASKPLGKKGRFFFGRIFPLPFLIAGACILFFGIRNIQRASESNQWPDAAGMIVSSKVESRSGDDGTTYQAEVVYDYTVKGVLYTSNRVAYGDYGSSNPSDARMIVNQYPKGKEVRVFYMPESPQESVLERGIQNKTYFKPAFGSTFFLVGLGMFIFLPKQLAKQAELES